MKNFTWWNPTIVVFGEDTLPQIADQLAALDVKKVFLLYGGNAILKNGVYLSVTEALTKKGIEYSELSGIKPNPEIDKVREGVARIKDSMVDAIVPIGGGSVFDSAKAIAAGALYDGDVWDLFEGKAADIKRAVPIFGVLTASATSSEVNNIAVVSNPERELKTSIVSPYLYPRLSVIDPSVQFSLSESQTILGGVDIMAHIMERLFDGAAAVDMMDEQGYALIRSMMKLIPELRRSPDDYDARAQYAWAACWGHNGFFSCGRGTRGDFSSHKLGHSLSLLYGVTHGASLSVMMPAWARYVYDYDPVPFARFAEAVFGVNDNDLKRKALEGIDRLAKFFVSIGAPVTLRDFNIDGSELERIAANAAKQAPFGVLKKLDYNDILEIYKLAY